MQRYFVNADEWDSEKVIITGDNQHHISRVMRMKIGDQIICNNPLGKAARCEIEEMSDSSVTLKVVDWLNESSELPVHVSIAQGLPKGDKLEFVLQKGTELGASRFIPFKADRSVVVWNEKKSKARMKRYEKIVKEASEQCHRNKLPIVEKPQSMVQLIDESKSYDVKIVAYEEEAKSKHSFSLAKALQSLRHNEKLFVCIGPEGGFSEQEIDVLKENNFKPVRLGPRILRTETAALYVLASISYHFEELRCD